MQAAAAATPERVQEPWNGEWYASFGHDAHRDWEEARRYGFVSAGGGTWYTGTLNQLSAGDRVWVRVPKIGYVGVGIVQGGRIALRDFEIEGRPAPDVLATIPPAAFENDHDRSEYVVPVRWLQTVPLERTIHRTGMFGNQNTVAASKTSAWRTTVEQLKEASQGGMILQNHEVWFDGRIAIVRCSRKSFKNLVLSRITRKFNRAVLHPGHSRRILPSAVRP